MRPRWFGWWVYKKESDPKKTSTWRVSEYTMGEEVLLFGLWRSPFSCRVKVALKLKGVQYKYIEENLSNKSALLLYFCNTIPFTRRFLFLYTIESLLWSFKLFLNTLMRRGKAIPYCPKLRMREPVHVSRPSS